MSRGGRKTRIIIVLFILCLLIVTSIGLSTTTASADPDVKVQLAIILDGSTSISPGDWNLIISGLAGALENPACFPQDGSVELTIIQFGWSAFSDVEKPHAEVEFGPLVITEGNVVSAAASIMNIQQAIGATPIACGILLAADTLYESPNFNPSVKQAINLVTDGLPTCVCDDPTEGYNFGTSIPLITAAKASTVSARNYLITKLSMNDDEDTFDAEFIGAKDGASNWLRDSIVWPQPGYYAPPFISTGWVRVVASAQQFADTICDKLRLLLHLNLTMQVSGCGTTTPAIGMHGYQADSVVDISAEPCPGWEFVEWIGDVADPGSPTTTVTMDVEKTVTAKFSKIPYTLTMQVDGCGSTAPSIGDHTYPYGTEVFISANSCPDWVFTHWTGDVANPNSSSTTVTVDSNKTVTAHFAPPVTLTMQVNGCGTTAPSVGGHDYGQGTIVSISADPCPGWEFISWSGPVANPSSPNTSVTMNTDKTVIANFEHITHVLTVQVDGCGTTAPSVGSYIHLWGDVVGVSVDQCTDWVFDNWTGDVADPNSPSTTVTMDSDKTITAHLDPPYTLTMQVNGCGLTGPSMGPHTYPPNTIVDISVITCPGWQFDNWTGGVGNSSYSATTVTMNSDKTVTANLSQIPEPLGAQLAVILDGSSSIEPSEWAVQIEGLYNAIVNSTLPRDGSVELTVIQFANDLATTEVPPTVIDSGNWDDVASAVMSIVKRNGITPINLGIQKAVEEITGSLNFGTAMRQVINISSDVGEYTLLFGKGAAEAERNAAIAAGIDVISAEGVGDIRGVDINWLRDSIVWPQPGTIAPPFTSGWVYPVDTAAEFEAAIGEKTQAPEATYSLVIGSGAGGSVTTPGEDIFTYPAGTVVNLLATPDTGWLFSGWVGDVANPSAANTTITMNQYHIISANFIEGNTLEVSSGTGGSVTEPGEGFITYLPGTVVNLTATPVQLGWAFDSWTGNVADPSSATTTITMNSDESVTANFHQIPTYTLTISSSTGGSVTEPGEGIFIYNEDTVVDLNAVPQLGWALSSWSGNVADLSSTATTITMNQNQTVVANFYELPIYALAVGSTIGGSVTEPGEGVFMYSEGTVVNLIAVANTGWAFDGWTGDVVDPMSRVTTITMNQEESVTATFVRTYTLTVNSSSGGAVTDPGEGSFEYKQDTIVTLTATSESGWAFDNWIGNVNDAEAATTTIMMTEDKSVTAMFVEAYILALSSSSGGVVTDPGEGIFIYKIGTSVDLTATPQFGREFVSWTGNVANTSLATTSITMYQNEVVVANFSGLVMRELTVQASGSGNTSPAIGVHEYASGTVVNLLATPNTGNAFAGWTGDVANPGSATTTITIDSDKTVMANFVDAFTLTIQVNGGGSTTPVVGVHAYPVGTVVNISAFPNSGWGFINWTGGVANSNSAATTVTMSSNKTVVANFYQLTSGKALVINVNGGGSTNPPIGTHLYAPGAVVAISATPGTGWQFSHWTSNVNSPLSASTTVTMSQDRIVTAYFSGVSTGTGSVTEVTPTPRSTLEPLPTPSPGPTLLPTASPTPTQVPVTTPTPVPTFTQMPTSMPTPTIVPTLPPPTLSPMPTPTPVSTPTQVPWTLIGATIAAVVGAGALFYVLRRQAAI